MAGAELLERLISAGEIVWRASWQASVLAGLVLAVQVVFGKRLSARWRHAMWLLVLVRLALPAVPSSPVSVFNLAANAPVARDVRELEGVTHVRVSPAPTIASATPTRRPVGSIAIPQSAAPAQTVNPIEWTLPRILACAWVTGAALLALRVLWATLGVHRAMRRLDRVLDGEPLRVLRETGGQLGVRRVPALLTGDGLFSPALVGFVRPKLLVPRGLLAQFEPGQLRLIFLHELAHQKRRDVLVNWAATLLCIVHWMNPLVWLVAWRLRIERELACDELVLSRTSDAERRAYGHTIVKLLETFARDASHRPLPAGSVGILEGKQQMKRRIVMIAHFARSSRTWTAVAACLVMALGLSTLTDAVSAEPPEPPAPEQKTVRLHDGKVVTTNDYQLPAEEPPSRGVEPTTEELAEHDAEMRDLTDRLNDVRMKRQKLLASVGPEHAHVRATDPEIKALEDQLQRLGEQRRAALRRPVVLKPGDLVTVSVMNLVAHGVESMKTMRVDGDGNVSFPYVGRVKAEGLRPHELEEAFTKAFKAKGVMEDAVVVVSMPERGESHQLGLQRQSTPTAGAAPAPAVPSQPQVDPPMMMDAGIVAIAPVDPQSVPAPVDPKIQAALDKQLPEAKFDNVPLSDVVDFLRDVTGANLVVQWKRLEQAGVARDTPVTLRVQDVALKDVLNLVLREEDAGLGYRVENGVIVIDVLNQPERPTKMVTRAYDVRELLPQQKDGNLFGGDQGGDAIKELMATIYETVSPESWKQNGGPGALSMFGTKLVITTTDPVHAEVVALLEMLRDKPTTRAIDALIQSLH